MSLNAASRIDLQDVLLDRPREDRRSGGMNLIGQYRSIDVVESGPDIAALDIGGPQLLPFRQQIARHQFLGLPITLVFLLGMPLDVIGGKFGKRTRIAFGRTIGGRILTTGDSPRQFGDDLAGLAQRNGAGQAR